MPAIEIVIEVNAPEPVYEQIVRQIHVGVKSGRLQPGAPVPTVRHLATDLELNRNTVARAYKLLEDQGVILTAGRKGTFVRQDATHEVAKAKTGHAHRSMRDVIRNLRANGLNRQEIYDVFKKALRAEGSNG
jgi:GntR family transcriptional regulator